MPQIVPAILEQAYEGFSDKAARLTKLPGVKTIHVDFGDGRFISNQLLPVGAIDALNPAFAWEAHLMVREPRDFLDYKIAGFSAIFIHHEAFDNSRDLREALAAIQREGLKPGLVINPGTPVEILKGFEKITNYFLIMGVHPGYQGQQFIGETLARVSALRRLIPNAIIEVDGGINSGNVKKVAQAGADLIVAGSAIVKAPDMAEAWDKLNAEIMK